MFITGTLKTKNLPALLTVTGFQKTLTFYKLNLFLVVFYDLAIKTIQGKIYKNVTSLDHFWNKLYEKPKFKCIKSFKASSIY